MEDTPPTFRRRHRFPTVFRHFATVAALRSLLHLFDDGNTTTTRLSYANDHDHAHPSIRPHHPLPSQSRLTHDLTRPTRTRRRRSSSRYPCQPLPRPLRACYPPAPPLVQVQVPLTYATRPCRSRRITGSPVPRTPAMAVSPSSFPRRTSLSSPSTTQTARTLSPPHRRRAVPQSCPLRRTLPLLLRPIFMPQTLPHQTLSSRPLRRQDVDARDTPGNTNTPMHLPRPRRTWNLHRTHTPNLALVNMRARHPLHQISTWQMHPDASPKSHPTTRAHRRISPSLISSRPWIICMRRNSWMESRKRSWSTLTRRQSRYRASPSPRIRLCSAATRIMTDDRPVVRLPRVELSFPRLSVRLSPSRLYLHIPSLSCTTTHRSKRNKFKTITMTQDSTTILKSMRTPRCSGYRLQSATVRTARAPNQAV